MRGRGPASQRWTAIRAGAGRPAAARGPAAGLTLLELLLALGLGMMLFMLIVQSLLMHDHGQERLMRLLRERGVQRRTLALLRAELLRAERLELGPSRTLVSSCSLAGRRPILHLQIAQGTVSYSLGAPPSAIWRGQVLMRCGPAYGLDGEPSEGASQNRVLLDGLATGGFEASLLEPTRLRLRLIQQFRLRDGSQQTIASTLELAMAEPRP
jgi:hypothetical protein